MTGEEMRIKRELPTISAAWGMYQPSREHAIERVVAKLQTEVPEREEALRRAIEIVDGYQESLVDRDTLERYLL